MFSIHLSYSAVTCNQPIWENSSALKSVLKRTKLPFCSLQHILYLLEKKLNAFDRNFSILSVSDNSIARFLNFLCVRFVKTKQKHFSTMGICCDEEGFVAVILIAAHN